MQLMATQIVISPQSGAEIVQNVSMIGKWVFVGNNLQLLDHSENVLATELIANIRKITFKEGADTAIDNVVTDVITVYPNPTQDILVVNGIDAQTLRVYNLRGEAMIHEHGTEINVTNLSPGTYLLQIGTQVIRFIKR